MVNQPIKFTAELIRYPLRSPFKITDAVFEDVGALIVTARLGTAVGRGEAQGVFYNGESADSLLVEAKRFIRDCPDGLNRVRLQNALPPGGTRNAFDCALWDLEAKSTGKSIWDLTGISPAKVTTAFTIGLEDEPAAMAEKARRATDHPLLKVKLNADRPVERIRAIRSAAPRARLIVDVNAGWTFDQLKKFGPLLAELNVEMIEQPLPRGDDAMLEGFSLSIPLCADESCLHTGELGAAQKRYQMINIKLDKTGGLTEALKLAYDAKALGLELMVGNMMGSSLAMAPSFVVAQLCRFVDIDGPLLLASDCDHPITYESGEVSPPTTALWG